MCLLGDNAANANNKRAIKAKFDNPSGLNDLEQTITRQFNVRGWKLKIDEILSNGFIIACSELQFISLTSSQ